MKYKKILSFFILIIFLFNNITFANVLERKDILLKKEELLINNEKDFNELKVYYNTQFFRNDLILKPTFLTQLEWCNLREKNINNFLKNLFKKIFTDIIKSYSFDLIKKDVSWKKVTNVFWLFISFIKKYDEVYLSNKNINNKEKFISETDVIIDYFVDYLLKNSSIKGSKTLKDSLKIYFKKLRDNFIELKRKNPKESDFNIFKESFLNTFIYVDKTDVFIIWEVLLTNIYNYLKENSINKKFNGNYAKNINIVSQILLEMDKSLIKTAITCKVNWDILEEENKNFQFNLSIYNRKMIYTPALNYILKEKYWVNTNINKDSFRTYLKFCVDNVKKQADIIWDWGTKIKWVKNNITNFISWIKNKYNNKEKYILDESLRQCGISNSLNLLDINDDIKNVKLLETSENIIKNYIKYFTNTDTFFKNIDLKNELKIRYLTEKYWSDFFKKDFNNKFFSIENTINKKYFYFIKKYNTKFHFIWKAFKKYNLKKLKKLDKKLNNLENILRKKIDKTKDLKTRIKYINKLALIRALKDISNIKEIIKYKENTLNIDKKIFNNIEPIKNAWFIISKYDKEEHRYYNFFRYFDWKIIQLPKDLRRENIIYSWNNLLFYIKDSKNENKWYLYLNWDKFAEINWSFDYGPKSHYDIYKDNIVYLYNPKNIKLYYWNYIYKVYDIYLKNNFGNKKIANNWVFVHYSKWILYYATYDENKKLIELYKNGKKIWELANDFKPYFYKEYFIANWENYLFIDKDNNLIYNWQIIDSKIWYIEWYNIKDDIIYFFYSYYTLNDTLKKIYVNNKKVIETKESISYTNSKYYKNFWKNYYNKINNKGNEIYVNWKFLKKWNIRVWNWIDTFVVKKCIKYQCDTSVYKLDKVIRKTTGYTYNYFSLDTNIYRFETKEIKSNYKTYIFDVISWKKVLEIDWKINFINDIITNNI